jgi:hypothetical protein
MEKTSNENFKGMINGKEYQNKELFTDEFVKIMDDISKHPFTTNYIKFLNSLLGEAANCYNEVKEGKECCNETEKTMKKDTIERPALYANDIDYIIPTFDEINLSSLSDDKTHADFRNKLETRMHYFYQRVAANMIYDEIITKLKEKSLILKEDANKMYDEISHYLEFLKESELKSNYKITAYTNINNGLSDLLAFVQVMIESFDDELSRNQNAIDEIIEYFDKYNASDKLRKLELILESKQ